MKRIFCRFCSIVLILSLLGGCGQSANSVWRDISSKGEPAESGNSSQGLMDYETYFSQERYYKDDMFYHVYQLSPSEGRFYDLNGVTLYQHTDPITAAYYADSDIFYFLSKNQIYRLFIRDKKVDCVYENDKMISFYPLTNYSILYSIKNPENEEKRPFDESRKPDLLFLYNIQTAEEKRIRPEDYGYTENLLIQNETFINPADFCKLPDAKRPESKSSSSACITYENYFSKERYLWQETNNSSRLEWNENVLYQKAEGVYRPFYQHDETIIRLQGDTYLTYFSTEKGDVYRVFLPTQEIELIYKNDTVSPITPAFQPLTNYSIFLVEYALVTDPSEYHGKPLPQDENFEDFPRYQESYYIYNSQSDEKKQVFLQDYGSNEVFTGVVIDPELIYPLPEE